MGWGTQRLLSDHSETCQSLQYFTFKTYNSITNTNNNKNTETTTTNKVVCLFKNPCDQQTELQTLVNYLFQ